MPKANQTPTTSTGQVLATPAMPSCTDLGKMLAALSKEHDRLDSQSYDELSSDGTEEEKTHMKTIARFATDDALN